MTVTSDDGHDFWSAEYAAGLSLQTFILAWIFVMLLRFNYGDSSGQTLRNSCAPYLLCNEDQGQGDG